MNFSILIQGPYLDSTSKLIFNLNKIFPEKQIIVSCYDEEIIEQIKEIALIVRNKDVGSIIVPPKNRNLNLKRQATTTYSGCKIANEEWIMKLRSDMEVINEVKLRKAVHKFFENIEKGLKIKLLTLNIGSLDIFSHYQMPFHFNDHFFICRRLTLLENCDFLRKYDEKKLIYNFDSNKIKNYNHRSKWSLKFHAEQLIHFCKQILVEKKMNYCCEMKKNTILRNIIWNAKNIMIYTSNEIGIRNYTHFKLYGSPKFRSELVGISFNSIYLYKMIYKSPRKLKFIFIFLLKIHGLIRKIIFIFLSYQSRIINKVKLLLSIFKKFFI